MSRVIVLHNEDGLGEVHEGFVCGRFGAFCTEHSALRVAYGYQTDRLDLEEVWRDNNRVTGDERPDEFGTRSLSVADVVVVVQDDGGGEAWEVVSSGWAKVDLNDVLEAAGRPARERTREKAELFYEDDYQIPAGAYDVLAEDEATS